MRRFLAIALGGVVLTFVGLALLIPLLVRPRAVAWLDQELDHQLGADVELADVSVGLLTTFPTLTVRVRDLSVQQPGTELSVEDLSVGLDLRSVLGSDIVVRRLRLVRPTVKVTVTDLPSASTAGSTDYAARLDDLEVVDLSVVYEDPREGTRAVVQDLDLQAWGSASDDRIRFTSTTTVGALTVATGGATWLDAAKVDADLALDWDATTGTLTLGDGRVTLNAMPLRFRGTVGPAASLDLAFEVEDTSFKSLLSLVPSAYDATFADVQAAGTLRLAGTVRGAYGGLDALPAFDVGLGVADGKFKYPQLPAGVDDLELDLRLRHAGGPLDRLSVDVRALELAAAGTHLKGAFSVERPVSDPKIAGGVQGVVDLAALRSTLPARADSLPPSGRVELDLHVDGRMSHLAKGRSDLARAGGTVRATDVRYLAEGWPEVLVRRLDLAISGNRAELRELALGWTESDLAVSGSLEGLLPYLTAEDGALSGELDLRSTRLDLRPFQGDDEAAAADEGVVVPVPTNVDVALGTRIGTLVTDTFTMQDVQGQVVVRDGAVRMAPIRGTMLGGEVTLNGTYAAPTAASADVDVAVTGAKLDLAQTVATFATLRRIAPLLEGATGRYDSTFGLKVKLNRDGSPDLSLVSSEGVFAPTGTSLRPAALDAVGRSLGREVNALAIDGARISYVLRDGTVRLDPFTAQLAGVPSTVSGSAGVLDRTLDLRMELKLPTAGLKGAPVLKNVKKALGASADVLVRLTGSWDQPKVAVGLEGEALEEAASQVVEQVADQAREGVDAVLAAARAQADELLAQAEEAADQLRSEARKQGDKLVSEARGNPLQEPLAKEAAKKLEKEADKAAEKVLAEARKKADQLLAEAAKQADAGITGAEKGAKKKSE